MKRLRYIGYFCLLSTLTLYAGDSKSQIQPDTSVIPVITPKDNNFYMGIGVGRFILENSNTKEELSSNTGALIVGYDLNRYLSLETRYTRGYEDISYKSGHLNKVNQDLDSTFTNIALYAKIGYAFENIKPYLLLGYSQSKIDNLSFSDRKEAGFSYGIGISYTSRQNLELFMDYVRAYDDKGFDGRSRLDELNLDMATFGIKYHF